MKICPCDKIDQARIEKLEPMNILHITILTKIFGFCCARFQITGMKCQEYNFDYIVDFGLVFNPTVSKYNVGSL